MKYISMGQKVWTLSGHYNWLKEQAAENYLCNLETGGSLNLEGAVINFLDLTKVIFRTVIKGVSLGVIQQHQPSLELWGQGHLSLVFYFHIAICKCRSIQTLDGLGQGLLYLSSSTYAEARIPGWSKMWERLVEEASQCVFRQLLYWTAGISSICHNITCLTCSGSRTVNKTILKSSFHKKRHMYAISWKT